MTDQNRNTSLTVGTTQVIVSNKITTGQRKLIVLTNVSTGTERISLAVNGNAIDRSGIPLYAGDSWVESIDAAFTPTQEQITAVSNAATAVLSIHERIGLQEV